MIGLSIAKLLKQDAVLLNLVPEANIFPYVANENTPLPILIYTIDNLDSIYSKDGWAQDEISFSVISLSEDYATLQTIVKEVRNALLMKSDTNTLRIETVGMAEGFNIGENVFMNKLSFQVKVNSY
jgi:hypothetical protein